MRFQASLVAFLVGCGDGDPRPPADAAPELRLPIDFEIRGETPLLLAIRDVPGGAWTVVPTNATGMYVAEATQRHQIAMVCGAAGSFNTEIEMRTRSDEDPFLFCFNGATPDPTFPVTGQMLQPGQISIEGSDESTTAPWTFDLTVTAGAHDVVAFGDSMALVRANIQITAATTISTIDLAQGGEPYVNTTAILANRDTDEMTETDLTVLLENGFASITRTGSTLRELPATLLGNGFQFGTIAAVTPTTRRDVSIDGTGVVTVTLLPRLSGITFTDLGSTWTTLPLETDSVSYSVFTPTNSVFVNASGLYLGGDTEVSVDLEIPGFDAAWRVPATERVHRFSVFDEQFSQTSVSSAPLPLASRARHDPTRAAQVLRERAARSIAR